MGGQENVFFFDCVVGKGNVLDTLYRRRSYEYRMTCVGRPFPHWYAARR
jgi:hypothetical protein